VKEAFPERTVSNNRLEETGAILGLGHPLEARFLLYAVIGGRPFWKSLFYTEFDGEKGGR
jgi:hypothetical protein